MWAAATWAGLLLSVAASQPEWPKLVWGTQYREYGSGADGQMPYMQPYISGMCDVSNIFTLENDEETSPYVQPDPTEPGRKLCNYWLEKDLDSLYYDDTGFILQLGPVPTKIVGIELKNTHHGEHWHDRATHEFVLRGSATDADFSNSKNWRVLIEGELNNPLANPQTTPDVKRFYMDLPTIIPKMLYIKFHIISAWGDVNNGSGAGGGLQWFRPILIDNRVVAGSQYCFESLNTECRDIDVFWKSRFQISNIFTLEEDARTVDDYKYGDWPGKHMANYWLERDDKYWSDPGMDYNGFTLDVGEGVITTGVILKNTHNGNSKDRGTKNFIVEGSATQDKYHPSTPHVVEKNWPDQASWEKVFEGSLNDSTCKEWTETPVTCKYPLLPLDVINFTFPNPVTWRYLKFRPTASWQNGSGLQYLEYIHDPPEHGWGWGVPTMGGKPAFIMDTKFLEADRHFWNWDQFSRMFNMKQEGKGCVIQQDTIYYGFNLEVVTFGRNITTDFNGYPERPHAYSAAHCAWLCGREPSCWFWSFKFVQEKKDKIKEKETMNADGVNDDGTLNDDADKHTTPTTPCRLKSSYGLYSVIRNTKWISGNWWCSRDMDAFKPPLLPVLKTPPTRCQGCGKERTGQSGRTVGKTVGHMSVNVGHIYIGQTLRSPCFDKVAKKVNSEDDWPDPSPDPKRKRFRSCRYDAWHTYNDWSVAYSASIHNASTADNVYYGNRASVFDPITSLSKEYRTRKNATCATPCRQYPTFYAVPADLQPKTEIVDSYFKDYDRKVSPKLDKPAYFALGSDTKYASNPPGKFWCEVVKEQQDHRRKFDYCSIDSLHTISGYPCITHCMNTRTSPYEKNKTIHNHFCYTAAYAGADIATRSFWTTLPYRATGPKCKLANPICKRAWDAIPPLPWDYCSP